MKLELQAHFAFASSANGTTSTFFATLLRRGYKGQSDVPFLTGIDNAPFIELEIGQGVAH